MSTLETLALQNIYGRPRTNPHESKLKAVTGMMPESGFAKPLLAMVAGKELAAAGEWDDQQEAASLESQKGAMQMLKEKRDLEQKQKNVEAYIKIAQVDHVAANAINEKLGLFPGINLIGKITKEGWSPMNIAEGDPSGLPKGSWMVYAPGLVEIARENDPAKKEQLIKDYLKKIEPTADKFHPTTDQRSFEAFANKYYLDNGIDPAKATAKQKNAAELFAHKQMEWSKAKVAGAGRSDNSVSFSFQKDAEGNIQPLKTDKRKGTVEKVDVPGLNQDDAPATKPPPSPFKGNIKDLEEGQNTAYGNGEVWTLKNGKPVRVK